MRWNYYIINIIIIIVYIYEVYNDGYDFKKCIMH